jgi:hypothetical protein
MPETPASPLEFPASPLSRIMKQPLLLGLFLPIQSGGWSRAGRKLGCHERIAEDANALSGNDGLDCVQLFPKVEMLHVLKIGQAAPLASGGREPSLPDWRLYV